MVPLCTHSDFSPIPTQSLHTVALNEYTPQRLKVSGLLTWAETWIIPRVTSLTFCHNVTIRSRVEVIIARALLWGCGGNALTRVTQQALCQPTYPTTLLFSQLLGACCLLPPFQTALAPPQDCASLLKASAPA